MQTTTGIYPYPNPPQFQHNYCPCCGRPYNQGYQYPQWVNPIPMQSPYGPMLGMNDPIQNATDKMIQHLTDNLIPGGGTSDMNSNTTPITPLGGL